MPPSGFKIDGHAFLGEVTWFVDGDSSFDLVWLDTLTATLGFSVKQADRIKASGKKQTHCQSTLRRQYSSIHASIGIIAFEALEISKFAAFVPFRRGHFHTSAFNGYG